MHNNNIIGIGCGIINGNTSWIAHIIVDIKGRGQGIGRQITEYLTQLLKNKGCETILLLATKLGEPVYRKVGFTDDIEYLFMKGDTSLIPNSQNIKPFHESYKKKLLALDKTISGEQRGHMILPHLSSALVYLLAGNIEGYFFPTLGEGAIYAHTSSAGIELLKFKLSRNICNVVLPLTNKAGITFLNNLGFTEYSRCIRMIYGTKIDWQPENIFSRIGGNMG